MGIKTNHNSLFVGNEFYIETQYTENWNILVPVGKYIQDIPLVVANESGSWLVMMTLKDVDYSK